MEKTAKKAPKVVAALEGMALLQKVLGDQGKLYKGEPSWQITQEICTIDLEAGEGEVVEGQYGLQLKCVFEDGSVGYIALSRDADAEALEFTICQFECIRAYEKNGTTINVGETMLRAVSE